MTSSPAVSVLIPCRDAAPYLRATLDSVLAQSLRPLEVIVVDDGSTDGSRAIAESYRPAVTVVGNEGSGASAARNRASRLARGEFFQYLDADDLLAPHALASRVEAIEASGADLAISDWQRLIHRAGEWQAGPIESGRMADAGDPADLVVLRGFWAPPAAVLYRRAVWERTGAWHEALPIIQDARFLFDAVRLSGRPAHAAGIGAYYREHTGGSLSTGGSARFWSDVLRNTQEIEHAWLAGGPLDEAHRQALAGAYAQCAQVGFLADRALFQAARAELRRFRGYRRSRTLRTAVALTHLAGYRAARAIVAPLLRLRAITRSA